MAIDYFSEFRYWVQLREEPEGFAWCVIDSFPLGSINEAVVVSRHQSSRDAGEEVRRMAQDLKIEKALFGEDAPVGQRQSRPSQKR